MKTETNTRIIFLVVPRVHLLDLAGPLQAFQEAMDYSAPIELHYCGLDDEGFDSSSGFPMGQLLDFRKVKFKPGDHLMVPGANVDYLLSDEMRGQRDLIEWINEAYTQGATISSICTGAFLLAQTGLLNGRVCTTHWKRTDQLRSLFPRVRVLDDILFTEDVRLYTSAGVTAGIDLALHIIGKMTDDHVSFKVARELVVYRRRTGPEEQHSIFMRYRNHIHTGIHRVQDYLQEHIERGANIPTLSEVACMSSRSLTRTFKRETGITVNEYVTLVRQERLRELAKSPDMTRKQMAKYCGLRSERQVVRLLKATLG